MCGIIATVTHKPIALSLLQGLQRLEYRGYDSAGLAVIDADQQLRRLRVVGKVERLAQALEVTPIDGHIGIAHTRWATHGEPNECNAHPHQSSQTTAVVHNGIIENYQSLQAQLLKDGYQFESETDTEVLVHLIHQAITQCGDFREGVLQAVAQLRGTFAIACMDKRYPDRIIAKRCGSPLVIGLADHEKYFASDPLALLSLAPSFIALEEGDLAEIRADDYLILDREHHIVQRAIQSLVTDLEPAEKGAYQHYMHKEIFEQPMVLEKTIAAYQNSTSWIQRIPLDKIASVQIVACGTSYHAGLVAKYWIEQMAHIPCQVDIASEFRYRKPAVPTNTLFIAISQSGETADTLAAFRQAKGMPYLVRLAICNVLGSTLAREAEGLLMTYAGREIGVASTKVFTTQLVVLLCLAMLLAKKYHADENTASSDHQRLEILKELPKLIRAVLQLEPLIIAWAKKLVTSNHILFLGRGTGYPIALEGALKLKEISYIHAEAYAAGELKHGPLALIDGSIPVIFIAPYDKLFDKIKANMSEVLARGGRLFVLTDEPAELTSANASIELLSMPSMHPWQSPFGYVVSLQLLAYHVAVCKGTDVDQPRNLAKSVTVE